MRAAQRLRSLFAHLALVLGSILLCTIVLEGGLRLLWSGYYLKESHGYAQPNPTRAWANKPSVRLDYGEPEFRTTVSHNSWGFRGPEITLEKPKGRCRVVVLGDSFAYGVGVEDEETFSARLEQIDPRLQVINTGVNGYGTSQQLLLLVEEGLTFAPDLVIVAFFWNDVANSYTRDFVRVGFKNGALLYPLPPLEQPEASEPAPVRRRYLRHSYAYRFLSDRLKIARYTARVALGIPVEDGELLPPEDLGPAWEYQYALLREIALVSRRSGANPLIVIVPEQAQVQPDVQIVGLHREDYAIQERLIRFGRSEGIPVLDPLPSLRAAYERDRIPLYYRKDRHLRANGHRILAERILEEIREGDHLPCLMRGVAQSDPSRKLE